MNGWKLCNVWDCIPKSSSIHSTISLTHRKVYFVLSFLSIFEVTFGRDWDLAKMDPNIRVIHQSSR